MSNSRSEPIYKLDSHGKYRLWYYEVEGNYWRTISGLIDGQHVASGYTVCDRAKSQETPELQAQFEAEAERNKKLERDYHLTMEACDTPNFFKPMLAKKYEGWPKNVSRVYAQPKLDGIRCIATAKGLFSREGKRFFSCPHIEDALAPFFERNPSAVLDGELYNHDLKSDFEKIVSMVRKQKPDEEALALSKAFVQYHVYDVAIAGDFSARVVFLLNELPHHPSLVAVDTLGVDNAEDLDKAYGTWLQLGYEGQMVRIDDKYEQKRSKFLLKRKEFEDAEFEIVDVETGLGNWGGYGKKIKFRMPDGRVVGAGVKGTQAFTKDLLEKREFWIGRQVTVRYFTPTADGIPRFPVAVAFHEEDERL